MTSPDIPYIEDHNKLRHQWLLEDIEEVKEYDEEIKYYQTSLACYILSKNEEMISTIKQTIKVFKSLKEQINKRMINDYGVQAISGVRSRNVAKDGEQRKRTRPAHNLFTKPKQEDTRDSRG